MEIKDKVPPEDMSSSLPPGKGEWNVKMGSLSGAKVPAHALPTQPLREMTGGVERGGHAVLPSGLADPCCPFCVSLNRKFYGQTAPSGISVQQNYKVLDGWMGREEAETRTETSRRPQVHPSFP